MKILLLLPIIAYLLLILVNLDLLHTNQIINLFGVKQLDIPFLLYNSIFIVIYSILIFFAYDGLNIFLKYKIKKQEKEIVELKSKLYNQQSDIIKKISKQIDSSYKQLKNENKEIIKTISQKSDEKIKDLIRKSDEKLENYKKLNQELLLQHGKQTDKILGKINLLDKGILDKIKDSLK